MYFIITDTNGLILKDAFGEEYITQDPERRVGFKLRSDELNAELMEMDSAIWPPDTHTITPGPYGNTIHKKLAEPLAETKKQRRLFRSKQSQS